MAAKEVFLFLIMSVLKLMRNLQWWLYQNNIPEPNFIENFLLNLYYGGEKLKKLEYLTDYFHTFGLFRYDKKVYIFNEKLAQTAINKLEKGAEHYLEDSPLKDTFLGSSQKSPEVRRAIASIFRKSSIDEKGSIMCKDIDNLCEKILKRCPYEDINLTRWSLRFALDVVGHVLLQIDFNGLEEKQESLLDCMMTILHRCYALAEIMSDSEEFIKSNEDFDKITSRVLETALNNDNNSFEGKKLHAQLHEACGFEQAKENMKLFLMAGTETTASTIPVVFYLLVQYPELQEELRKEANLYHETLLKDPTTPLPKLENVLREVLRVYPIAPFISRQNYGPVNIGNIYLEQNTDIIIFTWGIHRSAYSWDDAKDFKPFRFADKSSSRMYIPFGAGSRVCIGQHLAWLEIKLVVAMLLHRFKAEATQKTPDLKFVVDWAHAVVHPDQDMYIKFTPINR